MIKLLKIQLSRACTSLLKDPLGITCFLQNRNLRYPSGAKWTRKYPERVTLISNLIHDREAIMLYSPTGVGKTWLSLSIAMMVAGKGQLVVLDWENKDPQPVCYVDGEMLEEDM